MTTICLILTRPDDLWVISSHHHRVCAKSHQLLISGFYEWRTKGKCGVQSYSQQRTLTFLWLEESVFVRIWGIIRISPAVSAHLKELSPAAQGKRLWCFTPADRSRLTANYRETISNGTLHTENSGNYRRALKLWLFVTADDNLCSHMEPSCIYTAGAPEKHERLARGQPNSF